jgi:hypothetical protein
MPASGAERLSRGSAVEIVSIVAGGWSVGAVDLARIPGTIIGINDAALHLPRCDIAVSMDRLWTEYRYEALRAMMKPAHIRRSALQKRPDKWPWLNSFECDHTTAGLSDQRGVLNGTNSGHCGFNLAYQMRPKQILLFGFDMKRGPNGEPTGSALSVERDAVRPRRANTPTGRNSLSQRHPPVRRGRRLATVRSIFGRGI